AFGLRRVADPTTSAVLAFVLGLWLLAGLTMIEANRIANIFAKPQPRTRVEVARLATLAALPIAILVSSPQRPAVALVISFGYIVTALFSLGLGRANSVVLAYVGLVAAGMTVSWLRSTYLLRLNSELRS